MKSRLLAVFLCLLAQSCGSRNDNHESNPGFWTTSDVDLPRMIPNFCVRVRDVFETNNLDRKFRCRDNLGTSYAAAGSDSEKEVVLIVGAQDRWYLFAVFYEKIDHLHQKREVI